MRAYLPGLLFLLILIGIPIVLQRTLRPGIDFSGGTELLYHVDSDAAEVAGILDARLKAYGAQADAELVDRLIRVRVAATDRERLPAIRDLMVTPGRLEFRVTVEPGATEHYDAYWTYWKTLHGADAGDIGTVDSDRSRYPDGLRWYPVSERARPRLAGRLPDGAPWMLCALDPYNITEEALFDVRAHRDTYGSSDWTVRCRVKKLFQSSLARLTEHEPDKYLAIILDGEVYLSPVLQSTLAESGAFPADSEEEARRFAATLASGRLPAVPLLVGESTIPE